MILAMDTSHLSQQPNQPTYTMECFDTCPADWNRIIAPLAGASILQTAEWSEIKGARGWTPRYALWRDASGIIVGAALVLRKKILGPFEFRYLPRGPLFDPSNLALAAQLVHDLESDAGKSHALFIKIDRDIPLGFNVPGTDSYHEDPDGMKFLALLKERGAVLSEAQIQFANSVWIDLTPDEETLFANMKQRTRYKARLALKKGVAIRRGDPSDFEILYDSYQETAARDGFIIREKTYYLDVWNRFFANGMLIPLIAEVEGSFVAAVMLFVFAGKAWYIYGMSSGNHREKMPNYALQWEAIRTAKASGAKIYDLWGAPDVFDESDRMWGVYQFKRGLGGFEVISPGAYDIPLHPLLYRLYTWSLKALTDVRRWLYRQRHRLSNAVASNKNPEVES